ITSSTASGASPVSARIWRMSGAARLAGSMAASDPLMRPIGVRNAAAITGTREGSEEPFDRIASLRHPLPYRLRLDLAGRRDRHGAAQPDAARLLVARQDVGHGG